MDSIDVDAPNDTASIKFNYVEEILLNDTQNSETTKYYQKVYANCNMNIVVEIADINILGLNCIRKIAKKTFK